MTGTPRKVLVIGYGNPGRLDDGLGPAVAEALEPLGLPGAEVTSDYQLTVEDAKDASEHDLVVFADASVDGPEPFFFRRVQATGGTPGFSTHVVEPEDVLGLAHGLFQAETEGWVLGVRGYEFNEFGERLSEPARRNLAAAVAFLEDAIRRGHYREVSGASALDQRVQPS